ncbi:MORN repeat-containing protein 5 [Nomia melanderi]|uniref:MORN repeat-containing protein 5 n=1 Tax=Nomia melanderi TaxID=2448451 RepID=UPI0013040E93|nr:MORN repeat-containing protein 5-like [Nomia melanderi]
MEAGLENFEGVRFYNGTRYEGTWNALGMDGIGRYVSPHDVKLEGEFRKDTFHGHGTAYWPCGQRMDGVWSRGECKENRYNFTDGLIFLKNGWKYCKFPDRRYYTCLKYGLRPAGATLRIDKEKGTTIPTFDYDAGIGIFNPRTHCIASYRDPNKILEIPTARIARWIVNNCRKGWTEPTGHRRSLYERWIPRENHVHVSPLPPLQSLPKSCFESWWKRWEILNNELLLYETLSVHLAG